MNRMLRIGAASLVGLIVGSVSGASPSGLDFIRNAHRASRDAIRTVHATYDVETWNGVPADGLSPPDRVSHVEWWQDGDKMRWTETVTTTQGGTGGGSSRRLTRYLDSAVSEGTATRIQSQRFENAQEQKGAILSTFDAKEPIMDELWYRASFALTVKPHHTLAELLDMRDRVSEVESTEAQEVPYYRATVRSPESEKVEIEVWLDPRHNFLVKKWVSKPMAGESEFHQEQEVMAFRECEPSVYFPQETRLTIYGIGKDGTEKLLSVTRTRFRSVEINRPIDPGVFALTIPPGISVVDRRSGTAYRLAPDGKPTDVMPAPVPSKKPIFESVVAKPEGMQMSYVWAVVGVSLLLGAGVTAFLFHRKRRLATRS